MYDVDQTHDPNLKSWIESANDPNTDFPIQNLPFCVNTVLGEPASIGCGIGEKILSLRMLAGSGLLDSGFSEALSSDTLNLLMAMPVAKRVELRHRLSQLLSDAASADAQKSLESMLCNQTDATFQMPARIGDYTDFYASIFHATNVGSMFRTTNPLLPNYKHIPIGYHGRASSVVISGTDVRRPVGQKAPAEEGAIPTRSPSALFDYELEMGFFVAQGNELGETIPISRAEDYLFGMCLVNDWSARDIQKWEYQPLGPFLAKSFATTISPWIVTMQALAPFRCNTLKRDEGDPAPQDYLLSKDNEAKGGVDIKLEVYMQSEQMREQDVDAIRLSRGNFTNMYWTIAQMLTHHSSNGCNLQPGDMMASGTISGSDRESRGSMLELTWDGEVGNVVPGNQRTPIKLPTGEERKFIGDGDEITIRGWCENGTHRRIGFGSCSGITRPATV